MRYSGRKVSTITASSSVRVTSRLAAIVPGCGPCVQTAVNLAKADGVPADVLRAVLDRRVNDLPEPLRDVYRFAEAVVEVSGEEEPYRARLRQVFGEAALCELALAIATCRLFPTVKRALGYATSCSLVQAEV